MNIFLFVDVETSLFPFDPSRPVTEHEHYPDILEIAYIVQAPGQPPMVHGSTHVQPHRMAPADRATIEMKELKAYRTAGGNPFAIHAVEVGLKEKAIRQGIPLPAALVGLSSAANSATHIVSHNLDFDLAVIQAAYHRCRMDPGILPKVGYCTQKQTAHVTRIRSPKAGGRRGVYKWPTLAELYWYCGFGLIQDAHTAEADTAALARCFFFLLEHSPECFHIHWYQVGGYQIH